jgi:serine/threonine-protein kinase
MSEDPRVVGEATTLTDLRVRPPEAAGVPPSLEERGAPTPAFTTPVEALRHDELLRTRQFLVIISSIAAASCLIIPFLEGDRALRRLLLAALAGSVAACVGFLVYIRDPRRYSPLRTLIPAGMVLAAVFVASLYFGVFSAVQMTLVLGLYYFSISQSFLSSLLYYLVCALMQAAGISLTLTGVLPDRGLVRAVDLSGSQQLLLLVLVQAFFLTTYLYGRSSRRATLLSMEGLERALRQLSQREAQLAELNQDLERVLKGGPAGRFANERLGPWRLIEVIGRGAMGEVYRARHRERDLDAAVKLLFAQTEDEPQNLRRFLREADIMARLESPHLVRIYDSHDGSKSLPYIAMELLEGHDLAWYLRKHRTLAKAATLELVTHAAAALEQARLHDIVHRDLKPQNLFYARGGDQRWIWKVLDFGVSTIGPAGSMTGGRAVGTAGYMSPEQVAGQAVDHRADVFALAVIAYRALTGHPAFTGDDYAGLMFKVFHVQPVRPGELVPLPPDVEAVLALGLAKQARDRFASALELAEAFALALRGQLGGELRGRAAALLEAAPWGNRVG